MTDDPLFIFVVDGELIVTTDVGRVEYCDRDDCSWIGRHVHVRLLRDGDATPDVLLRLSKLLADYAELERTKAVH
jgi:hypothetical protein